MPIIYQSENYAFAAHRGGGASITRLADNASVYFQIGDEANDITAETDKIFTLFGPGEAYVQFDLSCSEYDELMDETARNQRLMGDA